MQHNDRLPFYAGGPLCNQPGAPECHAIRRPFPPGDSQAVFTRQRQADIRTVYWNWSYILRMHALHYLSSWRLVASFVGEVVVVVVPLSVKIKKSSMLPTDVRMGVLL